MDRYELETTPVVYDETGLKLLTASMVSSGSVCFRMHWHDRMELIRVRSGKIRIDFGTVRREIGPGALAIIHPRQPHQGVCLEGPLRYDAVMFSLKTFYNETESIQSHLSRIYEGEDRFQLVTEDPQVLDCIDRITGCGKSDLADFERTARMYQLFFLLYERCLDQSNPGNRIPQNVKDILAHMEQHYREDLSTDSLCRKFGYSKAYFCRLFRSSVGISPVKYLNILRTEKAYQRILAEDTQISRIAEDCGFPDANYFARCFKEHFGHTPSFFRKNRASFPYD